MPKSLSPLTGVGRVLACALLTAVLPPIAAPSSLLAGLDNEDLVRAGTALILFDHVMGRYWSGVGTQQGNFGLLARVDRVFDHISDPAARYYFKARVALYRGLVSLQIHPRRKARPYLEEALQLAEKSLEYRDSADAFLVRAEAGYRWLYSRRFRGDSRMLPRIQEWVDNARSLDKSNPLTDIIEAQVLLQNADDDQLAAAATLLEDMEARERLDDITRFRTRVLLNAYHRTLRDRDEARFWCEKAAEIFPESFLVADCR